MDRGKELKKLREEMLRDSSLPLREGATQLVFGDGNPEAEIFFLGEGPGYWEDMKGIPFVGNAGALLNRLLALIGIDRGSVFITNVVCYRPPGNRDPSEEEIGAFKPYVDRMIEVISPKVIVTLGRFSMGKFLPGTRITRVHGKEHVINLGDRRVVVVPMYHPAAALRNQEIMRQIREDFLKLRGIVGKIKNDHELGADNQKKEEAEQMKLV